VIDCPQCGTYRLSYLAIPAAYSYPGTPKSYPWSPELRRALSCAARQASEAGQPIEIKETNAAQHAGGHSKTRAADNITRLLFLIATRSERPGGSATLDKSTDFTLIDCHSKKEFDQYLTWITQAGLATWEPVATRLNASGSPITGPTIAVSLTMEGWREVQPVSRVGGIPGRCFVAMWFDPSMVDAFELGISKAVTDCGLPAPIRIDRKEHNNQITDEIIAAIRDAEFVIADFTGNRGGVYYEAGFARGLGRPVIHCCRDTDFDERHFDTKLINHIKWSDYTDLREKLAHRIKATIIPKA
jgi:hypothetical protein